MRKSSGRDSIVRKTICLSSSDNIKFSGFEISFNAPPLSKFLASMASTSLEGVTALGTIEHRVKGLELGADDYLMKPFAFAELLARVRTLLRRGAAVIIESQFQVADLMVDLVSRKVTRSVAAVNHERWSDRRKQMGTAVGYRLPDV